MKLLNYRLKNNRFKNRVISNDFETFPQHSLYISSTLQKHMWRIALELRPLVDKTIVGYGINNVILTLTTSLLLHRNCGKFCGKSIQWMKRAIQKINSQQFLHVCKGLCEFPLLAS